MATVTSSKKNAEQFDPRKHILHGSASHHSYVQGSDGYCLAYMRSGPKDHCVWVKLDMLQLESIDTSWVSELDHAAQTLAKLAVPQEHIDFILVKRGDRMVSLLTTSEDERKKRRVLRRVSRRLKKAKKKGLITVQRTRRVGR